MTTKNEIHALKTLAKRHARANRLHLHKALDQLAAHFEFPHWAALAGKAKQGWLPSDEQSASAEAFVRQANPAFGEKKTYIEQSMSRPIDEPLRQGKIGDHAFSVFESSGDIRMEGDGWRIFVGEALFAQPVVEIEKPQGSSSPANDRDFLNAALRIADEEAAKVRAGISSDWPRRSTKPDAEGVVVHPLFEDRSAEWFCLHCDGKITGAQLAENLWHCPACGAAPIDIFSTPFWLEGSDVEPEPVQVSSDKQRPNPRIEIMDSRPTLRFDEGSISLLLRAALLGDATTPGERLGALLAEISVDDENDACIVLDEELWPEFKEPGEAMAVTELLGVELKLAVTCMTFPFAWPGLGHAATSTREYVQMLLDAYAKHVGVHHGSSH